MTPAPGQSLCHHCTADAQSDGAGRDALLPTLPNWAEHKRQAWDETVRWTLLINDQDLADHQPAVHAYSIVRQVPYWNSWLAAEEAQAEGNDLEECEDIAMMAWPFLAGVVNCTDPPRPARTENANR